MKAIYCHHAQRDCGNPPSQENGLTKLGIKDAKLTAELFSQFTNIKAIYTSNFYRCTKTAKLINKIINVPIFEDSRLNEFKSVENETWVDLQKRIISLLDELNKKYNENDKIICVTSGVNVGAFICWGFNLEPSDNTPFIGIDSCSPLIFPAPKV